MLKVVRDEPGRQLLLEAERSRVAASVRGGIALLAVLFTGYRVVRPLAELGRMRSEAPAVWALCLFLLLGGVTLALRVYRRGWRPARVRADADASELELTDWNAVTGMERRDVIPLDHLTSLTVKLVPWGAGGRVARGAVPRVQLTVTLDERARRRTPPPRAFGVEGVDRPADLADLADRLGAATGMTLPARAEERRRAHGGRAERGHGDRRGEAGARGGRRRLRRRTSSRARRKSPPSARSCRASTHRPSRATAA